MLALTAANALWLWVFQVITLLDLAIVTGAVVTAGIVAPVVYTVWLPWRFTRIAVVILLWNAMIRVPAVLGLVLSPNNNFWDPWRNRFMFTC